LRGDQTWATLPAPTLTSTRIGFGSGSNLLTSSANFAFEDDRIIAIKEGTISKMEVARYVGSSNYGLYVHGGNLELKIMSGGGSVVSQSNHNFEGRILLNNAAGTAGQVLTSQGSGANPTWTTVSGGSVGTIDQVLAAGNTSTEKTFNFQNTDTNAYLNFKNNSGTLKGQILHLPSFNIIEFSSTTGNKLQLKSGSDLDLLGSNINVGYPYSNGFVKINGTPFKLAYSDFWAGTYTPALGDKVLFSYDSDKNAFVMQKIQVYTSPIDSKNYLVI
jgi:hypothetical protein